MSEDTDLKKRIEALEHQIGIWKIKMLDYRPVWHCTFENGWAFTPPEFVSFLTTTYPEDPIGPDELTDYKPVLWPEHDVLPFHCPHPVTGKPIQTPEPGLTPMSAQQ